jgi:glycosyltransferase involved in cell wall biosynthesis
MTTHILFVTSSYRPENTVPAIRVYETARRLLMRGYQVTILTIMPRPVDGLVKNTTRARSLKVEMVDGLRVIRVWSHAVPEDSVRRRLLAQYSSGYLIPLLSEKALGDPDIILVEALPLFNAMAARKLAARKGCPFVLIVADLWPESLLLPENVQDALLRRWVERAGRSIYQKAAAVWTLSSGVRDTLVQNGLSAERVFVLPHGVDTHRFYPRSQSAARVSLGWLECFTVLYAGSHGTLQGLETLLATAARLESYHDIRFVLVGEGSEKQALMEQAKRRNLTNVLFLPQQPHDLMPELFSAADLGVVLLRREAQVASALPLKMFEMMACARPIVLSVDGEARLVAEREAEAALFVEPENASVLVDAILYLRRYPEIAHVMGLRGRSFVENYWNCEVLTDKLEAHISHILKQRGKPTVGPV